MAEAQSTYRAVEILQTSATVAAIALALATLMQDEGPALRDIHLIPATLLLAGFVAVASSGLAVGALHEEMGLTRIDFVDVRRHQTMLRQSVIVAVATWALVILGVGYLWVLIAGAP